MLKRIRVISGIVLVVTAVVWIAWDIYAYAFGGGTTTLSSVITDFSYYSPALPLLAGGLIDHWFIPEFKPDRLLKKESK